MGFIFIAHFSVCVCGILILFIYFCGCLVWSEWFCYIWSRSYKSRFRTMNDGNIRRWREGKRHNAHLKVRILLFNLGENKVTYAMWYCDCFVEEWVSGGFSLKISIILLFCRWKTDHTPNAMTHSQNSHLNNSLGENKWPKSFLTKLLTWAYSQWTAASLLNKFPIGFVVPYIVISLDK